MGLVALLLILAGVALLRGGWHLGRAHPLRLPAVAAGWALIAAAIPAWMSAGGPDRGVVIAVLAFMLGGLGWVALAGWRHARAARARRRGGRRESEASERSVETGSHRLPGRVWVFVLAGPVAGAGSIATGLALQLALLAGGWHPANALAAMLLWVPLAWTALAVIATTHFPLTARSALVCGVSLAGALGAVALPGVAG